MATKKTTPKKTAIKRATTKPTTVATDGSELTIGGYLIQRLQDYGLGHVFGIPGDFVLQFYGMLEESPIDVIGCTREDNAGLRRRRLRPRPRHAAPSA